jgi:phosphate transport system substrate-binding protein
MKSKLVAFAFLALVALIGSTTATITMSGSTTVLPLGVALSESYTKETVSVSGGGTGAGMTALGVGITDIAMSSRQITTDEMSKLGSYTETKIGYDGLILIVGDDVQLEQVTKEQLKQIYEGKITNWKELGGKDEQIVPIGRESGSGTKETFLTDVIGDKTAECPGEQLICQSSAEVLQTVKQTPGAIGYVGYSYAKGVNVLAYENVAPTESTIKDKAYPLSRELYLYTNANASQSVKDFVAYAVSSTGQSVAVENGFIPI